MIIKTTFTLIFQLIGKPSVHIERAIAVLSLMGLLACVATDRRDSGRSHDRRNTIFLEEIANSSATDAYDLIETLRPHWLGGRGVKSFRSRTASNPVVYVDGQRHGDILSLTTLSVYNVVRIQYMNAGDATIRFGTGHPGGAILITMF